MTRLIFSFIALCFMVSVLSPFDSHAQAAPSKPKATAKLKIAAVVNDAMITTEDVNQRINMVIATTGLSNSPEVREELAAQVIQALVDETLQLTAAKQANASHQMPPSRKKMCCKK